MNVARPSSETGHTTATHDTRDKFTADHQPKDEKSGTDEQALSAYPTALFPRLITTISQQRAYDEQFVATALDTAPGDSFPDQRLHGLQLMTQQLRLQRVHNRLRAIRDLMRISAIKETGSTVPGTRAQ